MNTNLPEVAHGAEELQLQVKSAGVLVKEHPDAVGQILSEGEIKSKSEGELGPR